MSRSIKINVLDPERTYQPIELISQDDEELDLSREVALKLVELLSSVIKTNTRRKRADVHLSYLIDQQVSLRLYVGRSEDKVHINIDYPLDSCDQDPFVNLSIKAAQQFVTRLKAKAMKLPVVDDDGGHMEYPGKLLS